MPGKLDKPGLLPSHKAEIAELSEAYLDIKPEAEDFSRRGLCLQPSFPLHDGKAQRLAHEEKARRAHKGNRA